MRSLQPCGSTFSSMSWGISWGSLGSQDGRCCTQKPSIYPQMSRRGLATDALWSSLAWHCWKHGGLHHKFAGWLSISDRIGPALTTYTLYRGIERYCPGAAELVGQTLISITAEQGNLFQPFASIALTMRGGSVGKSWRPATSNTPEDLVKIKPIRIHGTMISIIQKFLAAFIFGYCTFVLPFAFFVFYSLLGEEWRLFELIWLSINGVYGLIAAASTTHSLLRVADSVTDYLLIKTVCEAVYEQRYRIPVSDRVVAPGETQDECRIRCAKSTLRVFLGFDPDIVTNWSYSGAESPMFEALDLAFGQVLVVEFSVMFIFAILIVWVSISAPQSTAEAARQSNIQDGLNAGAVLAWLLVVGLSLSAWYAAGAAAKKMASLLLEPRQGVGIHTRGVLTPEESTWRMQPKSLGHAHDLDVSWVLSRPPNTSDVGSTAGPSIILPADDGSIAGASTS